MAKKVWSRVHNKLPSGDLHVEIYCRILSNSPQGNLAKPARIIIRLLLGFTSSPPNTEAAMLSKRNRRGSYIFSFL